MVVHGYLPTSSHLLRKLGPDSVCSLGSTRCFSEYPTLFIGSGRKEGLRTSHLDVVWAVAVVWAVGAGGGPRTEQRKTVPFVFFLFVLIDRSCFTMASWRAGLCDKVPRFPWIFAVMVDG